MLILVIAVTVALVVSFLCSIFESVLLSISPTRIEALAAGGKRSGTLLKGFKAQIDVPIAAILIVNTIAHTIGATVAGARYVEVFSEQSLWLFSLAFTIAVLLFTEIIPKTLGVAFATRLAAPVAWSIHYLTLFLGPLVTLASEISRGLRGTARDKSVSIEDIRLLAALARSEGVVGPRTAGIIESATRLQQLDAADVLLPRQNVVFLSGALDADQVLETLRESRHSRFPFTPTGRPDDVSGVVLAKELLLMLQERPAGVRWTDVVRDALFIPETMPLNALLQAFRAERKHMAVVVDEYGGVEGIVTLEDVLEELVGDIIDESDRPVTELSRNPDGSVDVLGTMDMRKLCAHLGIPWRQEQDVVTVGGLVLTLLDRVPVKGDVLEWNGHRLEILSASETHADKIRIRPVDTTKTRARRRQR